MTSGGHTHLEKIAQQATAAIDRGAAPSPKKMTVRELLHLFGYRRRGALIVSQIRKSLEELSLRIVPDFEVAWIDGTIEIGLDRKANQGAASSPRVEDPTVRIDALEAAHRPPTVVDPDSELEAATTLMLLDDFSQLPVAKDLRKIQGIVSWKSIGSRLSSGIECRFVRECMDHHVHEIRIDAPLLNAVEDIARCGYTLVRDKGEITGIVTASDVGRQFMNLAGPFLLIGEIEGYLRILVQGRFTPQELAEASFVTEGSTTALGTADLTLGAHCRLLENPERWSRLGVNLGRKEFIKRLHAVREIRNDVMHFDPEGLDPEEVQMLQRLVSFFRDQVQMGAIE